MNEIQIYLGSACITEKTSYKYPIGERHAFLFYLRNVKDSDYDWDKVGEMLTDIGFDDIEFSKAGKVNAANVSGDKKEHSDNAMEKGSSLILYSDPIV